MKANELMIGDWVECVDSTHKKKVYAQIDAIEEGQTCILVRLDNCNWFLDISFIKPIPLTYEILEKHGFEEFDGTYIYYNAYYDVCINWCGTILKIGCDNGNMELADVQYVHELQHALRLVGIDKEIIL